MANEWKKIGAIRLNDNKKPYIKISDDISLSKGTVVQVQDPRLKIKEAVAAGRLSEEKGEEYLTKIPSYVAYDLVLPPPKK